MNTSVAHDKVGDLVAFTSGGIIRVWSPTIDTFLLPGSGLKKILILFKLGFKLLEFHSKNLVKNMLVISVNNNCLFLQSFEVRGPGFLLNILN